FDGDGVVAFMPAVIIGDHGHGGVADLGFAGQLGFLQIGHADDVGAPAAVQVRFRPGRELRAFHTDVRPTALAHHATILARLGDGACDLGTSRVAEGYVGDDPVTEEGSRAIEGAVDELVRNHKVGGLVLFLQRPNGRNRNNTFHAEIFHRVNVGPEVDL